MDVIKFTFFSTVTHEVDGLVNQMNLLYFAELMFEQLNLNHIQNVTMTGIVPFRFIINYIDLLFLDNPSFVFVG
jgi:hypothetical protein